MAIITKQIMNNKTIAFLLLTLAVCLPVFSQTPSHLPMWERKSAPAVILGRYVDWKEGDKGKMPSFWGNKESLKGGDFPKMTTDTIAHTFTFVWDICYPLRHEFQGWSILLFPGDTIRLDINKGAFAEYDAYKKKSADSISTPKLQELWKKAVHIEGGTFHQPLPIQMKGIKLGVSRECAQAHARDSYDEWCETCWDEFQDVVKQLDTLDLTPQEREFHRMLIEQDYLNKLRNFMFVKTSWKFLTDEDSLAMFEKQFTFKDPHVSELTYYRNITGFYACLKNLFNEGKEYIEANGLEESPLGRWFKELDEAKAVMTRVKARLSVTENQLNALSPEFQVQIKEVQALMQQELNDSKGTCRDLPEGAPQEWLPKIVAGHKGRVVFIDYWATWCGPCRTGMKAMESVKDELTARGVNFVYITDTSSNADDWLSYVGRHAGDHYIIPKDKIQEMQIPDYANAIPHYLIYDREGKLAKVIKGWPGLEEMKTNIDEVLK